MPAAVRQTILAITLAAASISGVQAQDVYVSPDASFSGTHNTNTSGLTATFTVYYENPGGEGSPEFFDLTCWGTNGISCQNISPNGVELLHGGSANVTVTFSTGSSSGNGYLYLQADGTFYPASDTGSRLYTIDAPVDVQFVSGPSSVEQYTYGHTATFSVTGNGTSQTYSITCGWQPANCTPSTSSVSLGGGSSQNITVTFDAGGSVATYPLSLTATSGSITDTDSHSVQVTASPSAFDVVVTPDGGSGGTVYTNSTGTATFTVFFDDPSAEQEQVFTLACGGTSGKIDCNDPASITLFPGESQNVSASYSVLSSTGAATINFSASGGSYFDSGSRNYTIIEGVEVTTVSVDRPIDEYSTGHTAVFSVSNDGPSRTYAITCSWTPTACTPSPSSVTVGGGSSQSVSVTYGGGNNDGTYTLGVTATHSSSGEFDTVNESITVDDVPSSFDVVVTNQGGAPDTLYTNSGYTETFNVWLDDPTASGEITFDLACGGSLLSCNDPGTIALGPTIDQDVNVGFTVGATTGATTLTFSADDTPGSQYFDSDSRSFTIIEGMSVVSTGVTNPIVRTTTGNQASIQISSDGHAKTYNVSCSWTSSCSLSQTSVTAGGGLAPTVTATYTAPSTPGDYPLTLTVTGAGQTDQVSHTITVVTGVDASVVSAPENVQQFSTGHSAVFRVTNTLPSDTYALTCEWTAGCLTVDPSSVTVGGGSSQDVTVTFNAGSSSGTFGMRLIAASAAEADTAVTLIDVDPYVPAYDVVVDPDGQAIGTYLTEGSGSFVFDVLYDDTVSVGAWFQLSCTGDLGVTCIVPDSIWLDPMVPATVNALFSMSTQTGTGNLTLTAVGAGHQDSGYVVYDVIEGIDAYPTYVPDPVLRTLPDSLVFTVYSDGSSEQIDLQCTWSPSSCTLSQNPVTLGGGASQSVTAYFDGGANTGTFDLTITATGATSGEVESFTESLDVVSEAVVVSVSSSPSPIDQGALDQTATFTVSSAAPAQWYQLSCSWPQSTCRDYPDSVNVGGGSSTNVSVTFDAGDDLGQYALTLTATGAVSSDAATATIDVVEPPVVVSPVSITADTLILGSTGQVTFDLKWNGSGSVDEPFTVTCGSPYVTCAPASQTVSLFPGVTQQVTIDITADAIGTGFVTATATRDADPGEWGSGSLPITVIEGLDIVVTSSPPSVLEGSTGNSATFDVSNDGFEKSYTLSCTWPGGTTCQLSHSTVTVGGATPVTSVTATFDAESPGTYELIVSGSGNGEVEADTVSIDVDPVAVQVSVQNAPSTIDVDQENITATFLVSKAGPAESYTISCGWPIPTCQTESPISVGDGVSKTVQVTFDAGSSAPEQYTLSLTASGSTQATASTVIDVVVPPPPALVITPPASTTLFTEASATLVFELTYDESGGPQERTFDLSCTADLNATCPVQSQVTIFNGTTEQVNVTLESSGDTGSGEVRLGADDSTVFASAVADFVVEPRLVLVATSAPPTSVRQFSDGHSATYDLTNNADVPMTFTIGCQWGPAGCAVSPASTDIGGDATVPVTVTFDGGGLAGSYDLVVTASGNGGVASDTTSVQVTAVRPVTVRPERHPSYAPPSSAWADTFEVRFPDQAPELFDFTLTCATLSCDPVPSTSVGDGVVRVPVTYTSGPEGDTSTVTFTATHQADPTISASVDLTVISTAQIALDVESANPGLEQLGSECVNVAAGAGAIVCDEFRFVYGFVPVARMNRSRQLGLVYQDRMARHQGVMAANFTLPASVSEPDQIVATLTVDGAATPYATKTYPSSTYEPGVPTRIAFEWEDESVPSGPQLISFEIELTPWVGGVPQTPVAASGKMISLEHANEFGRGWWLAGYENLAARTDPDLGDVLIWTGADASARVYALAPGSDSIWVAQTRARPDTIVLTGSGPSETYVRTLIGGGEVHYDSEGYHQKTVDRNGNETVFTHAVDGPWNVPVSVSVPTPAGPEIVYQLDYRGNTGEIETLQVASANGAPGTFDTYTFTTEKFGKPGNPYHITGITAPDTVLTQFAYESSTGRMQTVTDVRGAVTQVTRQAAGVTEVRVLSTEPDVVFGYEPASLLGTATSLGTFGPTPVAQVGSRLDGPLSGSGDTTVFFTTGWGAIRGVQNALGHRTWVDRENASYPALPTRVTYPNGRVLESTYYADGLLQSVIDRSTGATTTYAWDTQWSAPSQIVSPEGVTTDFVYDPANGNLDTRSVAGGGTTDYDYGAFGLMEQITDPQGHLTSLGYDPATGNLDSEDPPGVGWTQYARDGRGQITQTTTPIDATNTMTVTVHRDVMGRDTLTETTNTKDIVWVRSRTEYDPVTKDKILVSPTTYHEQQGSIGTGSTEWAYDQLGRVRVEDGVARDSLVYDLAGRLIERHTARGHVITMSYDDIGQLKQRVIPSATYPAETGVLLDFPLGSPSGLTIAGDTEVFDYDELGNMIQADNAHAQIRRDYGLNGALIFDEISMTAGGIYQIQHGYDLDGRRTVLRNPPSLSPGSDLTTYRYNGLGQLEAVVDPLGNETRFAYNLDGQVISRRFAGGGLDTLTYNDEHLIATRSVLTDVTGYIAFAPTYDHRGLITAAAGSVMEYTGLGQLDYMRYDPLFGPQREEWFSPNGLGQSQVHETYYDAVTDVVHTQFRQYYGSGGRQTFEDEEWVRNFPASPPAAWEPGYKDWDFDDAGNRTSQQARSYTWDFTQGGADKTGTQHTEGRSYYSADNKLRFAQVNRADLDEFLNVDDMYGSFDEYRYDALGRRIYVNTDQSSPICDRVGWCDSYVERSIWDGDQLLWERHDLITVGYVHAGGIDAPIEAIRNGKPIFPHADFRGLFATASDVNGEQVGCVPTPGDCDDIAWPAGSAGPMLGTDPRSTPEFYGSLLVNQQDASGMLYRRNRYYDPVSGQFTQEDPIGIAGGLNLYGYAGGDPVNFSDPFGLCDEPKGKGVGICIEAYIASKWALGAPVGDHRGPKSDGGSFRTHLSFSIDPSSGAISGYSSVNGKTFGITGRGQGFVAPAEADGSGGWNVAVAGWGQTKAAPLPHINYIFELNVGPDGDVSLTGGGHDGYPSFEIWAYPEDGDPVLIYDRHEGWVGELFGSSDVRVSGGGE